MPHHRTTLLLVALGATIASSSTARASCFCMLRRPPPVTQQRGITDDPSYTPTSAVFVTREGTRTVLTIEAAYQGPAVELSMVIPVPAAIEREQVRTVPGTVFRRLDQRTAPKVRHVWRPCAMRRPMARSAAGAGATGGRRAADPLMVLEDYGVEITDEWAVDEYDITLLGASESAGLLRFLRERGLELSDAADAVLRGYIETGHRFVLAHVDPSRANRLGDRMMLSPIQLEYESPDLSIPVRLGTLNSPGEQELLLYVLSTEGRYAVANRPNVEAPTDLRMRASARGSFAELYTSLTDEVFRQRPGAAMTEYAHVLGRHVPRHYVRQLGLSEEPGAARGRRGVRGDSRTWTLTRIRHRYGKDQSDDLTLRPAEPLRLTRRWRQPELRTRARSGQNAFHVQFVVEHAGCASAEEQRRVARRFATAESMWESRHDLWPGEVLLDRVDSLGIEPGSSAPAGWPPPPPEPERRSPEPQSPEPQSPERQGPGPGVRTEGPMDPIGASPTVAQPGPGAAVEGSPSAPAPDEGDGLCAIRAPGSRSRGGVPALLALGAALALVVTRRRRRAPRAISKESRRRARGPTRAPSSRRR